MSLSWRTLRVIDTPLGPIIVPRGWEYFVFNGQMYSQDADGNLTCLGFAPTTPLSATSGSDRAVDGSDGVVPNRVGFGTTGAEHPERS